LYKWNTIDAKMTNAFYNPWRKNARDFIKRAQRWRDIWNEEKPSSGMGMKGKTLYEKV